MKFEQYAHEANKFVNEIAAELGDAGQQDQAERIMTSVFHTLREIISTEESLHLISQLPMLIKGIYVNGWHISTRNRIRNMEDFIECLMLQNPRTAPQDFGNDNKAKSNTRAVLRVLKRHVNAGEIRDIMSQFPKELEEVWITEEEEHV